MLLEDLASWKLVGEERARNAMNEAVACTRKL
jgi:hypothetical protein